MDRDLIGRVPLALEQTVTNMSDRDLHFERVIVGIGNRSGNLLLKRTFPVRRRVTSGQSWTFRRTITFNWSEEHIIAVWVDYRREGDTVPRMNGLQFASACSGTRRAPAAQLDLPLHAQWLWSGCEAVNRAMNTAEMFPHLYTVRSAKASPDTRRPNLPAIDDQDTYEIYRLLLQTGWTAPTEVHVSVLADETVKGECLVAPTALPESWREAAREFAAANETPRRLQSKRLGRLPAPWLLAPGLGIQRMLQDDRHEIAWTTFERRYQGARGVTRVSQVGFDRTRRHAIVYWERLCRSCGDGGTHFFERLEGKWVERGYEDSGLIGCMWMT